MNCKIIALSLLLIINFIYPQNMTNWKIEPSLKYDLCCYLNFLTGDTFYKDFYKNEPNPFLEKITPEAKLAIDSLYKKLKLDKNIIISAWLCLYFSAIEGNDIDDMINAVKDPAELKSNFEKTPYYDDESWETFTGIKQELLVVLNYLQDSGFKNYWTENIKPKVDSAINKVNSGIDKYDVIKENEYFLGFKLPSDTITVYMLHYNMPHGIKITGMRFISAIYWPFEITVRTAAHEMMHPPYDYKNDKELRDYINSFSSDKFFMDKVNNHNKSLGYNTIDGLFEEDCVQALDQMINEKLGIAKDAGARWKESDEEIHVLAVVLYKLMKETGYNSRNEIFRDYLLRLNNEGKLKPGMLKKYYDKFYEK